MTAPTDPLYRDFAAALRRLGDAGAKPAPGLLHQLSGASRAEVATWRQIWPELAPERRRELVRQLAESSEADFQLDFRPIFVTLIDDPDPEVRAAAIDGLWEATELSLIGRFAERLEKDPDDRVRARAAAALGVFVERGELEDRCAAQVGPALELLIEIAADEREDLDVRRRALESAGFADREDVQVLIEYAIDTPERALRAGALRAMGHSADVVWEPDVLAWLDHVEPELRFEAARAAGELSLTSAVPQLARLIEDGADRAVQIEAIAALGEIGGAPAQRALERLAERIDPDEAEDLVAAIDDALSTAALADGVLALSGLSRTAGRAGDGELESDDDDEEDDDEFDEDELDDELFDDEADWLEEDADWDALDDALDEELDAESDEERVNGHIGAGPNELGR